jgi:hypothetical protein
MGALTPNVARVVAGPWGPVRVNPRVPRRNCAARGCLVMVPKAKAGGLCHGCRRQRPLCARYMPLAGEPCRRRARHTGPCRSAYAMENQRMARWYGVK